MKTLMKQMQSITLVIALFSTGATLAGVPADTGDQTKIEDSKRCIDLARIKDLDVIDDQTILFHMIGNKTYKNMLPHRCTMLGFEKGIAYQTSMNRLCNVDTIKVLNYGATCILGMFEPYVEDDQPKDGS